MIDVSTLKKAWALLTPHERRNGWIVLAIVSLAAVSAAFMVGSLLPFLTVLADTSKIHSVSQLQWVYSTLGFTSDYAFLVALGLLTLTIILVSNGLQLVRVYVITRYAQMRIYALSRRLLGAYLDQPYEYFLDHHSGEMSTRVLAEVDQIVRSYLNPVLECIASALTIFCLIVFLVWLNPAVALGVMIVFGSCYGALYLSVRGLLGDLGKRRVTANQERFQAAKEVLGGIKEVKLHGNEDIYLKRYATACYRTIKAMITSNLLGNLPNYVVQALALGGVVILCLFLLDPAEFDTGDGAALADLLPLIGVIAFSGQRLMPELSKFYKNLTQMKFGKSVVETLYSDLVLNRNQKPPTSASQTVLRLTSELQLNQLIYRYPHADKNSLMVQSLTIKAGERIGIIGTTGAGKTTIADLILGLLNPTSGQILADGIAINATTMRAWQENVSYVPQDIFLIDASLYENIAFGVAPQNIDRERVEKVARMAQLDGFVESDLVNGYETKIGERGVRLSGGQRQRIGIARAFYHDTDIIIFDEATSALDNVTEREVMSAIDATPGDKTMLMIAHRLSTVQSCDRIILMDKGTIAAVGSWAELMDQSAVFRELASAA